MRDQRLPIILLPKEGTLLDAGGDRYRILATQATTDGTYGLWEANVPPGGGPPPHRHSREEEGFYIIAGEVAVYVDGRRVLAQPGSFINMPKGTAHWFRNESDQPAKMLVLVSPGGMEGLFEKTGQLVTSIDEPIPPITDREKGLIARHAPEFGIELIHPPNHGE
ncbi:cupin domain-containing protein [bacterium]|nr:cupin domain-containing protein [bacterium]